MRPKKSLGQNFLRDPKILKKIVDFANLKEGDTVVEVGPGEGGLTKFILERAKKVIAIEKDDLLANKLKITFENEVNTGKLELINADILNYELGVTNYVMVGNIPYYITGELFRKSLESKNQPKSICFVVQKEVAERIMVDKKAQPSGKATAGKESVLSISVKAFGTPEFGGVIKAGSFFPKPKVDSVILAVRDINIERFKDLKIERFFQIVKTGFAHKRKFLIRNLETGLKINNKVKIKEVFQRCGLDEKVRAEDIKVEDWVNLAKNLEVRA